MGSIIRTLASRGPFEVRYCVALDCGGADVAKDEESEELELDEESVLVVPTGPGSLLLTLGTSLLDTTVSLCAELLMVGASFCLGSITANVTETTTTTTRMVEMRPILHFFRESIVVAGAELSGVGFSTSGPAFWPSSRIGIILSTLIQSSGSRMEVFILRLVVVVIAGGCYCS